MQPILLEEGVSPPGDTALCLGTFDGVHLGHQALVSATVQCAAQEKLIPCAYTFDLPPAYVLSGKKNGILTDIDEKTALLCRYGLEMVFYNKFDLSLASRSAESFFSMLKNDLRARHIIIGFHYHFGSLAKGDAALMKALCGQNGVGLTVVPPVKTQSGELVSSTAIRGKLSAGDEAGARQMLNRTLLSREERLLGGRMHE